jgi:hypothetical protein
MEVDPHDPGRGRQAVGGENKLVGSFEIERDFPHTCAARSSSTHGQCLQRLGGPAARATRGGIGCASSCPCSCSGLDVAQSLSDTDKNPRFHLNITHGCCDVEAAQAS